MTLSFDWSNTSILVTGHTGFKGSWLSLWLHLLGAEVHGYALNPPTSPNLFEAIQLTNILKSDTRSDLLDLTSLDQTIEETQPQVIFHLAAQSLVRQSYTDPQGTFATNVMGTINLLEAIRRSNSVKAVVVVTTDKVYQNQEWNYPYREVDPLGGRDPYSASKAAAEIAVAGYRASYFSEISGVNVATARAGNVIGGGDWAADRLVPDCLKAFQQQKSVQLRYPNAVRPWQHVLEPLQGYLMLAEKLLTPEGHQYASAWNFGPYPSGEKTVREVATMTARCWGKQAVLDQDSLAIHPHETLQLKLDISRSRSELGWEPRWSVQTALKATVDWHQAWLNQQDMYGFSSQQIRSYQET